MGTIEDITNAIDDELITTGKEYLSLIQAKKLLIQKDLLTIADSETFRNALVTGNIIHAYQTDIAPRQWCIPLSKSGKKRLKEIEVQRGIKHNRWDKLKTICPTCGTYTLIGNHCKGCGKYIVIPNDAPNSKQKRANTIINCPNCFTPLKISKEILKENRLYCSICESNFNNPLLIKSQQQLVSKWQSKRNILISNNSNLTNVEYQQDQFLKYGALSSFGCGFFFPPVWILSLIFVVIRVLRRK